ncbi:MAG: hypothetical protein M1814_000889 [Vezdaea aestivalis]|nr:MAG: hypothetical protein M1814_000889 [Vezdaea aestivalis]
MNPSAYLILEPERAIGRLKWVEGTDLSPIQPTDVPINVRFVVDDARLPWIAPVTQYTLIHTRQLAGCFEDFRVILAAAFANLSPGGHCESHEMYTNLHISVGGAPLRPLPPENALAVFTKDIDDVYMDDVAQPLRIANKLARWYQEAGFVGVKQVIYEVPVTEVPQRTQKLRDVGQINQRVWQDGINGMCMAPFTRYKYQPKEQVEVSLVSVRQALAVTTLPIVQKCFAVWGRKPIDENDRGGN